MKASALQIVRAHEAGDYNPNIRGKRAFKTTSTVGRRPYHDFASAMARACGPKERNFTAKIGRFYSSRFYER